MNPVIIAIVIVAWLLLGFGSLFLLLEASMHFAWYDWRWWLMVIGGLVGCILAVTPLVYDFTNQPPCVSGHYETRHAFTRAGNVTIPRTYQAYVCDVYEEQE